MRDLIVLYAGVTAWSAGIVLAFVVGVRYGERGQRAILAEQREELRIANDRLYAAWQAGAQIPPRPAEAAQVPEAPLPALLMAIVNDWESPEGKRAAEAEIRGKLLRGYSPEAIFREHENSVKLT